MSESLPESLPLVTIVVVNYDGAEHLADCCNSLAALDYPKDRVQVILVDNGSHDGSLDLMQKDFPWVTLLAQERNLGFARANNIGVEHSEGEYVAFLNNDTRVERSWLKALVGPVLREENLVCTAARILDWEGEKIDFVAGALNFYGHAWQKDQGALDDPNRYEPQRLLFACGGSMLIRRSIYLDSGGFDDDFFAYFEDVDLGWRLNLMGYNIQLSPDAITYHRHLGTAKRISIAQRIVLYERNALYTIYKNYDDEHLSRVLTPALLLLQSRSLTHSKIETGDFLFGEEEEEDLPDTNPLSKVTISHQIAADHFAQHIPSLREKRSQIQARRIRTDKDIFPFFLDPLGSVVRDEEYNRIQEAMIRSFGIDRMFGLNLAEKEVTA